jgi:hypothetical protein
MLKSLAHALFAAVLLVFSVGASAQTDRATAETLMRKSGLWKQFESVAPQMRSGIASAFSQGKPAAAELDRIGRISDAAFAVQRLRSVAQDVIVKGTKPAHVPALLAWYGSPSGIALTKLEEAASADQRDPMVAMREDMALLSTLRPSRQAKLSEIAEVTRSAEALTNMTINTTIAVQLGVASALPGGPAISAAEMRRAMEAQRPEMLKAYAGLATAIFARTYADVPDQELTKYITFLKSAAGRHFMDIGVRALDAALVDAALELGRNIPGTRESSRT